MGRIVDRVAQLALGFGAPGLFVVAFLDSSFLSLPEINDLLLVWMVTRNEAMMPVYATAATLGSIAGCLVLYFLGRKGGDAVVRRRFHTASVDKAIATVQRYGVFAVLIPSLLPPPMPFKIFVLLAGVAEINVWRFVAAIAIGRGIRYFGEGLLAVWYGDEALQFIHANSQTAALAAVGLALAALAGYVLWTKSSGQKRR